MQTDIHFWYLAHFCLESEMFQTKAVQKIKTHILCSVTFSRKSCSLWDNVEKYCRAGQTTDGNMAHAHCMLDTKRYTHTLRICNTYCCSTTTVVAWTRRSVTLYIHSLCCGLEVDMLRRRTIYWRYVDRGSACLKQQFVPLRWQLRAVRWQGAVLSAGICRQYSVVLGLA